MSQPGVWPCRDLPVSQGPREGGVAWTDELLWEPHYGQVGRAEGQPLTAGATRSRTRAGVVFCRKGSQVTCWPKAVLASVGDQGR